ncbi:glycosyltransferase [Paenibacillus antarcticus]|uniref:glycosyltransferase n=1 Tax=Paenibacillus antarcticus TaxID=253703 RepID=UPI00165D8BCB|nr:glycosyltransferase [Paenibacillus antarcticus]
MKYKDKEMKAMAIIVFPPFMDWSWMKQRPQHLMTQFARAGHSVYYCNKTSIKQAPEPLEPNLVLVHHHERWLYEEFPKIRQCRKDKEPIILWCMLPTIYPFVHHYSPDLIIYDCVDDMPEWTPFESQMVATSHAVICTSERLKQRLCKQYPHKRVQLVRNGYNPDMQLHHSTKGVSHRPSDLPSGQLIGFVGAWATWIDTLLIQRVAKALANEASVVLIGPEFGRRNMGRSESNLHLLGHKPHHLLPSYIRQFSVCLIPFRRIPIALAANPVKAYEYLASGAPVISTSLPECILMHPHVVIAHTPEQFINKVRQYLYDRGDPEPRIQYALSNTWEQRYQDIHKLIVELLDPFND